MMIQNTTFLRRAVGSLLVALVTLVGFQANAQLNFDSTTSVEYDEADGFDATSNALLTAANGGTSLGNLNTRIGASGTAEAATCYKLGGHLTYALDFVAAKDCKSSDPEATSGFDGILGTNALTLEVKENQHVNFENGGEDQVLTITGYVAKKPTGTLTVNVEVDDHDESPYVTQTMTARPNWYLTTGDSETLLISQLFRDPEGDAVYFDGDPTSTDVWVCDTSDAGNPEIGVTEPLNSGGTTLTAPKSTADFQPQGTAGCSVSNEANPAADPAPDPNPGIAGAAGNRVVTTKKRGPVLTVTANSVVHDADTDPATPAVARPKGTYTAQVFFRVWTGTTTANRKASLGWASARVHVKIGANNLPQFAGGAVGYTAKMKEGATSSTEAMEAWAANDIDAGGDTKDTLTYSLENAGDDGKVSVAGGKVGLTLTRGDNPRTTETETTFVTAIALAGEKLDFEALAPATTFTIGLLVTDSWIPKESPVRVPITVTLEDANELERTEKKFEDLMLVHGHPETLMLNEYFVDPEGDDITYSAHTNIHTGVAVVDNEAKTLTINDENSTADDDSEVTVTLTAMDAKGLAVDPINFDVATRRNNQKPTIDLVEAKTIAIAAGVFEKDSAGEDLVTVEYDDDDPAPKAVLTGNGSDKFTTSVDGAKKEVTISVGDEDLDHETGPRYVLELQLRDAWDDSLSEGLEIQITVNDSNDDPFVKEGAEIADQGIVVNGSASLYTGDHFDDQDGDRLLISASSGDPDVATVDVVGFR